MRKRIAALLLLTLAVVVLSGCASQAASEDASRAQIQIVQTSSVPVAARHEQGGFQVEYAIRITNPASEQVTLKRIALQSQSEGAYYVNHSLPFDVVIGAGSSHDLTFRAPAQTGRSIVGANGPVTLRVTAEFDSPTGKFREIATRVVNDRATVTGEND